MKAGDLHFLKDTFFYSNTPPLKKGTPVLLLSVGNVLINVLIEDKKYLWDRWAFEEAIEKSNE